MRSQLLTVSLCALLTAPVLANAQQSTQNTTAQTATSVSTKDTTKAANWITVASARDIIGNEVRDHKGKDLGTIEYLLIGFDDARVRFAVVSTDGDQNQLVPVPWTALNIRDIGNDVLVTDRNTFTKQKTYTNDQIAELTEPSVVSELYSVWAPVTSEITGEAMGQSGSDRASGDARQQRGKGVQAEKDAQAKKDTQATKDTQAQTDTQNASGTQNPNGPEGEFLVGRQVVTTVMPPVFQAAGDMRGTEVYSSDGKEYGSIDNLLLDLDHDRLAYVQVGHGGFLGMGEEITPVPYEALTWDHEHDAYQVNKTAAELEKVQRFARGEEPKWIKATDLAKLYDDFGVEAYWQNKS